jgi:hypothetical protein
MVYHKPHSITSTFVNMNKFYSLTTLAIALTLFAQTVSAQTYSGGTYTALLPGAWHGNSPTPIWQAAEPPATCNNCLIQINAAGTVTLNTHFTLTGGSKLVIGSGATLVIPTSSATDFTSGNNIILDGTGTQNQLQWVDNTSFLDATGADGYNGILISLPTTGGSNYLKSFGTSPGYFNFDPATSTYTTLNTPAAYGTTQTGPTTLSSSGTLPITLSGFNAFLDKDVVNLTWSTQLEINSDHFAIERSTDAGAHWYAIGTVAAHGLSATVLNYNFTDSKPAAGTNQYRLQLVDKDGKYAYSEVKAVRNGLVTAISIYPNPARDYVNITLAGGAAQGVVIRLLNQSGQMLQEKNVSNAAGTTVPLAVGNYPQGNYLIVVLGTDGSKQVSKLMISK